MCVCPKSPLLNLYFAPNALFTWSMYSTQQLPRYFKIFLKTKELIIIRTTKSNPYHEYYFYDSRLCLYVVILYAKTNDKLHTAKIINKTPQPSSLPFIPFSTTPL